MDDVRIIDGTPIDVVKVKDYGGGIAVPKGQAHKVLKVIQVNEDHRENKDLKDCEANVESKDQ